MLKLRTPLLLLLAVPLVMIAQMDPAGEWIVRQHEDQPERGAGPELGDYLGLPINNADRQRADSWDASLLTLQEWQCRPHPADYGSRGPANLRFWRDIDTATQEVIAYHTMVQWQNQIRTIWMDGRPHPPAEAPQTWQGFSTGKWEGNMLTVYTTHLKAGYIRRNGVARSDEATMTEHWIRHENYLTLFQIIDDPVYLTEPMVRSTDWEGAPDQHIDPYPCEVTEEINRPEGVIPHHLPGTNTFITEFADRFKLPVNATRGGAVTMYPEYKLKAATAQPASTPAVTQDAKRAWDPTKTGEIRALQVRGNVYLLSGAGANITLQFGKEGVMLVDTGMAGISDNVLAAIRKLTDAPIHWLIDTSADPDHVGGNAVIRKAGATIAGGDMTRSLDAGDSEAGAQVIANEGVLERLSARVDDKSVTPFEAWPTETFRLKKRDMFFNDEAVQLLSQPAAHTDGDVIVFFRRSDVVSTGDVFVPTNYPVIDLARGGSINGEIAALNRIIDVTVPAVKEEGGTMVVPGHGRICDEADVADYRDMITIIRDRVQALIKEGKTLEQVKAARPTMDYDPRFGTNQGKWTTDMFVEAVYQSLKQTS